MRLTEMEAHTLHDLIRDGGRGRAGGTGAKGYQTCGLLRLILDRRAVSSLMDKGYTHIRDGFVDAVKDLDGEPFDIPTSSRTALVTASHKTVDTGWLG